MPLGQIAALMSRAGRTGLARFTLPPRIAFALLAFTGISFLAGTNAPTALYATYQAAWHFSPITTTIIFGIYAVAVLGASVTLFFVGTALAGIGFGTGGHPALVVALAGALRKPTAAVTSPR